MLRTRLNDALKDAVLARDQRAVSTIRLILAALKDRDIAERGKGNLAGLSDNQILSLLRAMIKQRQESIHLYEQGGRPELAQEEAEEIRVIDRFLPESMSEDETAVAVAAVIEELEAKTLKDMGRVMATLRDRWAGRMDFGKASALVKARLG